MAADPRVCPVCGAAIVDGAARCASCGAELPPPMGDGAPAAERAPGTSELRGDARPSGADLTRRIARLQQWAEAAEPLELTVPSVPPWAEEAARTGPNPEAWFEVVRGVERLAQLKIVAALEGWERLAKNRLTRLEAYSVDGRLEREQIDDTLHAARSGDIAQALQIFHQVDRVLSLKERHLDQAREELERLVSLLRDMEALGLPTPLEPAAVAEDLERELRQGRLAALKQELRAVRLQAVNRLKVGLPEYVGRYGEFLVSERNDGTPVELEAAELARAAREFARGHPEEALRRLRVLAQVHGSAPRPGGGASGTARP